MYRLFNLFHLSLIIKYPVSSWVAHEHDRNTQLRPREAAATNACRQCFPDVHYHYGVSTPAHHEATVLIHRRMSLDPLRDCAEVSVVVGVMEGYHDL